jgi:hypothetical protein
VPGPRIELTHRPATQGHGKVAFMKLEAA